MRPALWSGHELSGPDASCSTRWRQVTGPHRKSLLRLPHAPSLARPPAPAPNADAPVRRGGGAGGGERVWASLDFICAERLTPAPAGDRAAPGRHWGPTLDEVEYATGPDQRSECDPAPRAAPRRAAAAGRDELGVAIPPTHPPHPERIFAPSRVRRPWMARAPGSYHYSTVTDLARLRGWSTSQPRAHARRGTPAAAAGSIVSIGTNSSSVRGHVDHLVGMAARCSSSPSVAIGDHRRRRAP